METASFCFSASGRKCKRREKKAHARRRSRPARRGASAAGFSAGNPVVPAGWASAPPRDRQKHHSAKEGSVAAATTFKYNFIQLSEVFIYVDIWIFRFVFSLCPRGNQHPHVWGGGGGGSTVRPLPLATPLSLKQPSLGQGGGERGGVAVPVLLWIGGKGGESRAQGGGACVPRSSSRAHRLCSPLGGCGGNQSWLRRGSRLGCKLTEISQLRSDPAPSPSSEGRGRGSGFRNVQFIYTQPRERQDGWTEREEGKRRKAF